MSANAVRPRRRTPVTLTAAALVAALVGIGAATSPAPDAAAAAPAPAPAAGCVVEGVVTTCTFGYTGTWQNWTVPPGVRTATFRVVGASGGWSTQASGGRGGGVVSTQPTTAGWTYRLYVGGLGGSTFDVPGKRGMGGFNGGGNGAGSLSPDGAGGGGASDVRIVPYHMGQRILVGGGGGGAGSAIGVPMGDAGLPGMGGDGGSLGGLGAGEQGTNVSRSLVGAGGGGGGTFTGPGFGGGASNLWLDNACGFWNSAVAVAGNAGAQGVGGAGGYLKSSWSGARCDQAKGWGGGGGGGWYGGGGGGAGVTGGAGGGGGSGYAPHGSGSFFGKTGAAGKITISYVAPTDTWASLGGELTSAPTLAARPQTGSLPVHDVFYLGARHQVVQRVVTDGVPGPAYDLGGTFFPGSTIAATWRPDGQRLDLFGRGTESALWHKAYTPSTGWSEWEAITDEWTVTSDPTASHQDGSPQVFFRGFDNELQWWHLTGTSWYGYSRGGFLDTSPGGAVSRDGKELQVFYYGLPEDKDGPATLVQLRDAADRPAQTWFSPRLDDDQLVTSAVASSSPVPNRVSVIFRDQTSGLSSSTMLYDNGYSWSSWEAFDAPPSPAGSAPALLSLPGGNGIVYLRGNDNTLIARVLDIW